uniref:Lipocalin n=1 Tax=Rhipicephalus appendiculatus TaxID=34631 RepID=A0A131Z536_RHIAP
MDETSTAVAATLSIRCTTQRFKIHSLAAFYAAGATIWIVNTTMLEPKYCEVDYVNHTSYKYAFFERDYNKSGTKHKEILAGMYTRMDSATFNGMRVFQRNAPSFSSYEKLLSEYGNYACGVFNVTLLPPSTGTYYDMRVKDSAVENPHASCLKKFEELSRGEYITNLFNNSCRKSR